MPGLWDNHQHLTSSDEGALDLANGVTSARDMANDTDTFPKRVERYDNGTELGPRVLKAGIIDGTGEFAGPTKMRVDTAEEAIKDVDWYADHGYVQMKIYSSIKPELVPVIADRAHAHGMRVSGHVPAFMSARQFIEGGADEIQHFNFIELNFLFPEVKETRNRDRFIKVAEHAREFTPDKPQVREFIEFPQTTSHCARSDDECLRSALLRRPDRSNAGAGRNRAAISGAGPARNAERRARSARRIKRPPTRKHSRQCCVYSRLSTTRESRSFLARTNSPVIPCITSSNSMCAREFPRLKCCAWRLLPPRWSWA